MKYLFLVKTNLIDIVSVSATIKKIEAYCRQHDIVPTVVQSTVFGEEEELVRRFVQENRVQDNREPTLRVIVCGGLETFHFAINGLFGVPGVEVGYFPCDGDYDFYSVYPEILPSNFSEIGPLLDGRVVDVDVIQVNRRYCINAANIGLDANISAYWYRMLDRFQNLPLYRFRRKTLFTLCKYHGFLFDLPQETIRIRLNGYETIEGPYTLAAFANTKQYGFGHTCAPNARADDGLIDVLFVTKLPLLTLPRAVRLLRKNEVIVSEEFRNQVFHKLCSTATVELSAPKNVSLDGVVYVTDDRFEVRIHPAAMRVLIPETG